MSRLKRVLLICALLAAVVPPASHALAASEKTAKQVKAELARSKAEHARLEKEAKALDREVKELKSKMVETTTTLRQLDGKLGETNRKLKKLRAQKAALLGNLYKDKNALGSFVSAAQRYGRASTPQILLQSTPIDAARASLIMRSSIPALQQHSDLVQGKLDELKKIETAIADQLAVQSGEFKKINAQEKEIARLLDKRETLYQQTDSERKKQQAEVARLTKEAKNLEDLVLKIRKSAPKAKGGYALPANMLPPASGPIVTGFGETDELGAKSKGVSFDARPGSTVVTPLAGTVRFAGPFQKFRQILIIEHKGGYHSLIAGLGRISTVTGASVAAGEPVGAAGTGDDVQPVYYELRRNGDPIDPRKSLLAKK